MALFRLASACAFKDLRYLIHRQVLWPTNLNHPIMCTGIVQHGADKTSHVLYRHKIDGIVVAFSDERMGCRQHLLDPQAGTQKGCWITEIAAHHFCPLLLQLSKVERGSGHRAYWFALRKQMLSNNAAETATGPNDQDHVRFLSHSHRSSFRAIPC